MNDNLEPSIASVFSILPEHQARDAESELLKNYKNRGSAELPLQIHWVEFNRHTRLIRSGLSDLEELRTEVYLDDNLCPEVQRLVNRASRSDFKVGLLEKVANEETFLWYVPSSLRQQNAKPEAGIKGLSVSSAVFEHIMDIYNEKVGLTAAEKRVIFQLTAGMSLAESASLDQVSVETKRAHLKHASGKLQCNGQTDVVRLSLGQIVHLISITSSESRNTDIVEAFAKRYFGSDVNFSVQRLRNGRVLRVFDCGPADGKPLILIHGLLYPLIICNAVPFLYKHGIRLIMPVRHGFLEERSIYELYRRSHLQTETVEDIAMYIESSYSRPVAIMGQSMGSAIAMRLVKENPGLFGGLLCASINQGKANSTSSIFNQRFFSGLRQLLSKPGVLRLISWQFRKYYADEKVAKKILRKMFEGSSTDCDVLDVELGNQSAYSWFRDSYKSSIVGIAEDFSFTMNAANYDLDGVTLPITFIQGKDDPMTNAEVLASISQSNPACQTILIDEGGHFSYGSHPDKFWSVTNRVLTASLDSARSA